MKPLVCWIAFAMLLSGCSLKGAGNAPQANVRIVLEPSPAESYRFRSAPSTFSGFSCLGVNVLGSDIPREDGQPANGVMLNALFQGTTSCAYRGLTSPAITNVGGTEWVADFNLPIGAPKLFQVVGVVPSAGSTICNEGEHPLGASAAQGEIYEIGRAVVNLSGSSTTVSVPVTWDSLNAAQKSAKRVNCGGGGGANSGTAFTQADFALVATTGTAGIATADCGAGSVAVFGGADCGGTYSILSQCSTTVSNSGCTGTMGQYFYTKCNGATAPIAYAACLPAAKAALFTSATFSIGTGSKTATCLDSGSALFASTSCSLGGATEKSCPSMATVCSTPPQSEWTIQCTNSVPAGSFTTCMPNDGTVDTTSFTMSTGTFAGASTVASCGAGKRALTGNVSCANSLTAYRACPYIGASCATTTALYMSASDYLFECSGSGNNSYTLVCVSP